MDRDPQGASTSPLPRWLFGLALVLWGLITFGLRAPLQGDELLLAAGAEWIVLGLLDLLWAGALVALTRALAAVTVLSPALALAMTPLFYHGWSAQAVIESLALGAAIALPLAGLTAITKRASATRPLVKRDPQWLVVVRWILRAALATVVLAFDLGDFDSGAPLVIAGSAVALISLMIILPYRTVATWAGRGKLLAYLGGATIAGIVAVGAMLGGRMSVEEAAIGAVPAAIVMAAGVLMAVSQRGRDR